MDTIESKVARAILQHKSEIEVNGITYPVEQPTVATLIEVSSLCSQLPDFDIDDAIVGKVLLSARECIVIGKIAAYLILGAKRVKKKHVITKDIEEDVKKWSWRKMRKVRMVRTKKIQVLEFENLAAELLEETDVETLRMIITARLADMQIGDFFAITTSLKGTNIIKSTKEVETASGE